MTDEKHPGAYIGHEPERVPRRENDGGMTLPGDDENSDTERIDVVEGEVGSANLKEPKDIEPVNDSLSDQGALAGDEGETARPA